MLDKESFEKFEAILSKSQWYSRERLQNLQSNAERFHPKEAPRIAGRSLGGQTSGSTGTPINHRKSSLVNISNRPFAINL
ncbi:MAG: hypothetical protein AB8B94_08785 [Hyphomicrobiales bacterium]